MKRLIVSLAAIGALSACVSVLPKPVVPDALYRLGPAPALQNASVDRLVLVREPEAPRILAGSEIAVRDGQGAIRLMKGAEWADRLPRMFQMTLLDHLGTDGRGFALLPEAGVRADMELSWRLSEFALQERTALAQAELVLLDGKTRVPLKKLTVKSTKQASSDAPGARAEALSEAGRDIISQAGQFIASAQGEVD